MTKQYTEKEILELVPDSWNKVKFKFYQDHLLKLDMTPTQDPLEMLDRYCDIAAIFVGMSSDIVRQFPMTTINKITERLQFLNEKPKRLKETKYRWIKKLDDPSYDTYITFMKVSEQLNSGDWSNFPLMIKTICLDTITDEEVMELTMDEVETAFFFLRKSLLKSLEPTTNILITRIMIERWKNKWKGRKFKTPFKKTSKNGKEITKKSGDGI